MACAIIEALICYPPAVLCCEGVWLCPALLTKEAELLRWLACAWAIAFWCWPRVDWDVLSVTVVPDCCLLV